MNEVLGQQAKKNPESPIAVYAITRYSGWDINVDQVEPRSKIYLLNIAKNLNGEMLKQKLTEVLKPQM